MKAARLAAALAASLAAFPIIAQAQSTALPDSPVPSTRDTRIPDSRVPPPPRPDSDGRRQVRDLFDGLIDSVVRPPPPYAPPREPFPGEAIDDFGDSGTVIEPVPPPPRAVPEPPPAHSLPVPASPTISVRPAPPPPRVTVPATPIVLATPSRPAQRPVPPPAPAAEVPEIGPATQPETATASPAVSVPVVPSPPPQPAPAVLPQPIEQIGPSPSGLAATLLAWWPLFALLIVAAAAAVAHRIRRQRQLARTRAAVALAPRLDLLDGDCSTSPIALATPPVRIRTRLELGAVHA